MTNTAAVTYFTILSSTSQFYPQKISTREPGMQSSLCELKNHFYKNARDKRSNACCSSPSLKSRKNAGRVGRNWSASFDSWTLRSQTNTHRPLSLKTSCNRAVVLFHHHRHHIRLLNFVRTQSNTIREIETIQTNTGLYKSYG